MVVWRLVCIWIFWSSLGSSNHNTRGIFRCTETADFIDRVQELRVWSCFSRVTIYYIYVCICIGRCWVCLISPACFGPAFAHCYKLLGFCRGGGGRGINSVGPTMYTLFKTFVLPSNEAPAVSTYGVAVFILKAGILCERWTFWKWSN